MSLLPTYVLCPVAHALLSMRVEALQQARQSVAKPNECAADKFAA